MDGWDPMEEDFKDKRFNSYHEGLGQDLQSRAKDGMQDKQHVQLYITGIPAKMDKVGLENLFLPNGKVVHVSIPENQRNFEKFGSKFGFVTMINVKAAQNAIQNLDGFKILQDTLHVKISLSKEEKRNKAIKQERSELSSHGVVSGVEPLKPQGRASLIEEHANLPICGPFGDSKRLENQFNISNNFLTKQMGMGHGGRGTRFRELEVVGIGRGTEYHPNLKAAESDLSSQVSAGGKDKSLACLCCGREAFSKCRRCKSRYCSLECQKLDWPNHKNFCKVLSEKLNLELEKLDLSKFDVEIEETFIEKNFFEDILRTAEVKSDSSSSGERQESLTYKGPGKLGQKPPVDKVVKHQAELSKQRQTEEEHQLQNKTQTKIQPLVQNQQEINSISYSQNKSTQSLGEHNTSQNPLSPESQNLRESQNLHDFKGPKKQHRKLNSLSKQQNGRESTSNKKKMQSLQRKDLENQEFKEGKISPQNLASKKATANQPKSSSFPQKFSPGLLDTPKTNQELGNMKRIGFGGPKPMENLILCEPVQVFVSYIESPGSIWVQRIDQLENLESIIKTIHIESHMLAPLHEVKIDDLVLSKCEGIFCRARVTELKRDKVVIFYLDYGNSEIVSLTQLLPVSPNLASSPALAYQCRLKVRTIDGNRYWKPAVIEKLKEQLKYGDPFTLIPLNKDICMYDVKLIRNSDKLDITDYLLENGLATTRDEVQKLPALQPSKALSPQRFQASQMKSVAQELKVRQLYKLLFIEVKTPLDFYMQIFNEDKCRQFRSFIEKMKTTYNEAPLVPYRPVVGELVAGRFTRDRNWYRAEVLDVGNETAHIRYVDYGNSEQLPFREIHPIKSQFISLPIQGFRCAVAGVRPPSNGMWNEEQIVAFGKCLSKYMDNYKCDAQIIAVEADTVWVDLESNKLQLTLSETLTLALEAALLPQPLEPVSVSPHSIGTKSLGAIESNASPLQVKKTAPITMQVGQLDTAILPLNILLNCGVHEIRSCLDFYVTHMEALEDNKNLHEALNSQCRGLDHPPKCQSVKKGDLVLLQFTEDKEWYRARVESITGSTCRVFYIDYGNEEETTVSSLLMLPDRFKTLPAQAINCCLSGITPPVPAKFESDFHSMCSQTKLKLKALSVSQGKYEVELFTNDDVAVVDILKERSLKDANTSVSSAKQKVKVSSLASKIGKQQPESPPPAVADVSFQATGSYSPNVRLTPVQGHTNLVKESPLIPSFVATPALVSEATQQKEKSKRPDCLTISLLPILVPEEREFKAVITHFQNPQSFFFQALTQCITQQEGMNTKLQEFCESSASLHNIPRVGDLLCGKFDGIWYRCVLTKVLSDELFMVRYIDFGNEEEIQISDLRGAPKDLCVQFPLTTFRGSLHGIRAPSGGWSQELVKELKAFEYKPIDIKVLDRARVDLWQVSIIVEGMDLASELIKAGSVETK